MGRAAVPETAYRSRLNFQPSRRGPGTIEAAKLDWNVYCATALDLRVVHWACGGAVCSGNSSIAQPLRGKLRENALIVLRP